MNLLPQQVPVLVVAAAVWILFWGYWLLTCVRFFDHVGWWL